MSPISVMHIISKLPVGGVENQLLTVLRNYDRKMVFPSVCSLAEKGEIGKEIEKLGIEVLCLNKLAHRFDYSIVNEICSFIRKKNSAVVRTHQYHANLYGRIAARRAGVPCIVASVHNVYTRDKKLHRRIINNYLARFTDRIVAVSGTVKEDIIKYDRIRSDKVTVIFNGVDIGKFSRAQGTVKRTELGIPSVAPVIGTVGRLTYQKGHVYLLEAAASLKGKFPDLVLLIVGDGEKRSELYNHAKTLGIVNNVKFLGTRRDIPELLAAMDVFVLPSFWEGMVNALIEAMAAGKPVIASDIPPVREIINTENNGFLVPAKNSSAIAHSIELLLNNRSLAERYGKAARERASSTFSIDFTIDKYMDLFQAILRKKQYI